MGYQCAAIGHSFFLSVPPLWMVSDFQPNFFFILHYGRFWIFFYQNCNTIRSLHRILHRSVKGMEGYGWSWISEKKKCPYPCRIWATYFLFLYGFFVFWGPFYTYGRRWSSIGKSMDFFPNLRTIHRGGYGMAQYPYSNADAFKIKPLIPVGSSLLIPSVHCTETVQFSFQSLVIEGASLKYLSFSRANPTPRPTLKQQDWKA